MDATSISVGLGERSYPIHIGPGIRKTIATDLQNLKIGRKYGVITDTNVGRLYGGQFMQALGEKNIAGQLFTLPAGESGKTLQTIGDLASRLVESGFDRSDALIAFGGGVVGDITGFLASCYMRGVPFVQVPTTLLAQVDSSVGGKTGVDIPEGKNLVGAFYQPKGVYIDIEYLQTLPKEEYQGGLAEVIKYAVIRDSSLYTFLEHKQAAIKKLHAAELTAMITRCCAIKAEVVARDEKEGGLRRILNYGHTIGHAVEAASDFSIIHGYAVAIGMVAAAQLAPKSLENCDDITQNLANLLIAYGLPTSIPKDLDPDEMARYLRADKKTVNGRLFFVLPEQIGKVCITDQVKSGDIDAILHRTLHL